MSTSKEYKDFVMGQLCTLDGITCRPMMGEYLLYLNSVLFGGIYDNRLLVKITDGNKIYNMKEELPYDGAKPMYLAEDIDNPEKLCRIITDTCSSLEKKQTNT